MNVNDIESIELELTSRCNAACPQCPRTDTDFLAELNHKREITVDNLKRWLPQEIYSNLKLIVFKGTFSDPLISKHFTDIIKWIKENCAHAKILIHTNGSLRNKSFWKWLALNLPLNSYVTFAIDGLADTHSIYRVNTDFNKIIKNAKIFIENGGNAHWQYIIFKHNEHQIEQARNLSQQLGFKRFFTMYSDRTVENEFTKSYNSEKSITKDTEKNRIIKNIVDKSVTCKSLERKRIFINWDGEVFPCCWTGVFATKTKNYFDLSMWKKQILQNDYTNNSLKHHTLHEIMQYFNNFYNTVEKEPKLRACAKYCGIKSY
jgi:MoaA/NifB/PqqE/SkfB family radical SAM enzyme